MPVSSRCTRPPERIADGSLRGVARDEPARDRPRWRGSSRMTADAAGLVDRDELGVLVGRGAPRPDRDDARRAGSRSDHRRPRAPLRATAVHPHRAVGDERPHEPARQGRRQPAPTAASSRPRAPGPTRTLTRRRRAAPGRRGLSRTIVCGVPSSSPKCPRRAAHVVGAGKDARPSADRRRRRAASRRSRSRCGRRAGRARRCPRAASQASRPQPRRAEHRRRPPRDRPAGTVTDEEDGSPACRRRERRQRVGGAARRAKPCRARAAAPRAPMHRGRARTARRAASCRRERRAVGQQQTIGPRPGRTAPARHRLRRTRQRPAQRPHDRARLAEHVDHLARERLAARRRRPRTGTRRVARRPAAART